jgi:WD40 repeat protein
VPVTIQQHRAGGVPAPALRRGAAEPGWADPPEPAGLDGPPADRAPFVLAALALLLVLAVTSVTLAWRAHGHADDALSARGFRGEINAAAAFRAVAFGPNGTRVFAATGATVEVWNVVTRRRNGAAFTGHAGTVTTLVLSPNGRVLATAGDDGTVRLWDTTTRRQLGDPLMSDDVVRPAALAIDPAGSLLAVTGEGGTALWNLATRQPAGVLVSASGAHVGVAFSPDGTRLATGDSNGGAIGVWDIATRQPVGPALVGHLGNGPVHALAFDLSGTRLADGSADNTSFVWTVRNGERVEFRGHDQPVTSLALTADGRTLVTASRKEVLIWDVASGGQVGAPVSRDGSDDVNDIALGPDGDTLAVIRDHRIQFWTITGARKI